MAQWDPLRKQVAFFIVPGLNFGLRSAVTQFHRVPVLCTALARRCLMIPCGHYFDDYACVEPKGCGKSAQYYLRELHRVLGVPLACGPLRANWICKGCDHKNMVDQLHCGKCKSPHADIKSSLFAQSNIFLGVETDFANFAKLWEIRMRVPPEKCARTAHSISKALLERELAPMAAAKIRGWLQFFLTWCFGRLGRAALQPIADRQYRDDGRFTPALEAALRFLQHILQSIPACAFQAYASTKRPKKRAILVWSDAAYEKDSLTPGTLGFVIFVPTEPSESNPNPSCKDGAFYHASAQASPRVMPLGLPPGSPWGHPGEFLFFVSPAAAWILF